MVKGSIPSMDYLSIYGIYPLYGLTLYAVSLRELPRAIIPANTINPRTIPPLCIYATTREPLWNQGLSRIRVFLRKKTLDKQ